MSEFDLLFYSPLYGTQTLTVDLSLQGDTPQSNVADFTSNIVAVTIPASDLGSLFTVTDGVVTAIDTTPFVGAISSFETDFFSSTAPEITVGGQTISSLTAIVGVPQSFSDITSASGAVLGSNITNTGTSFTDLLAQINDPSNAAFRQYFYNDAAGAGGATTVKSVTFLIQYDVTHTYNYTISGVEYPATNDGLSYYYDYNGTRFSLTSLTESVTAPAKFALRFNLG